MLEFGANKTVKIIEIGSIVRLKSGGPKMTVELVVENEITCIWHAVYDFRKYTFKKSSLEIAE